MKKLILIQAALMTFFVSVASEGTGQTIEDTVATTTENEQPIQTVSNVRANLLTVNFSKEMMNDLFGEEDLFFPKDQESYDVAIYIVDLLIENQQYDSSDKDTLIELVNTAYAFFNNNNTSTVVERIESVD